MWSCRVCRKLFKFKGHYLTNTETYSLYLFKQKSAESFLKVLLSPGANCSRKWNTRELRGRKKRLEIPVSSPLRYEVYLSVRSLISINGVSICSRQNFIRESMNCSYANCPQILEKSLTITRSLVTLGRPWIINPELKELLGYESSVMRGLLSVIILPALSAFTFCHYN